jgi:hypothetical protein
MEFQWPGFDWHADFRPGNLRNTVNQHPVVFGIVLGLVLLAVFLRYYLWSRPPGRVVPLAVNAYYVDEATGQESVQPANLVPPLPGADGKPTVVRAVFFSADGGQTRIAGYYEKYTPEAKALLENPARDMQDRALALTIDAGHLIRSPAPGSPWNWLHAPEAAVLVHPKSSGGKPLLVCDPP